MKRRNFIKTGAAATIGLGVLGSLQVHSIANTAQPGAGFKLPKLPYNYDDLEPFIDRVTMEIHHSKHHAGYVSNLNTELAKIIDKPGSVENICANISKYSTAMRNNAGGHYNHSFFWPLMAPALATTMSASVNKALTEAFGSVEQFKTAFRKAALSVFGSGWAWLIRNEKGKLEICTTANQDNPLMDIAEVKGQPIIALDVWEHAYYLKHQNKRSDYIDNWWQILNWDQVKENLSAK